ncbi:MAG: 2-succinyl-5-enolpyruvyl-6-hydroxy-3-cyclohexene-1-carboxylic-acid synthase, partial [Kamptonema sp. SIO4C4]|nr:2-succinyl-5-enolpyruvyl-6-hydroxy-3-cyclohexene-1-carboxylic-acid synthase [Kamptonema sp. SIO4C4]
MAFDFQHSNLRCATVFIEALFQQGLTTAVVCPGSRSTPLTIAVATHPEIEAIPILDERSAAFFALGLAKRSYLPVILICTSGTAGANFYPAVIEASLSHIPLIILTADRPPELRHCHANQTIDQQKLYGNYPNWQTELAIPDTQQDILGHWQNSAIQAWMRSQFPQPGVVHLN